MSDTSIRTPAWGVTLIPEHTRAVENISIRTPAWGGDPSSAPSSARPRYFNSHPRVGGDKLRQPQPQN